MSLPNPNEFLKKSQIDLDPENYGAGTPSTDGPNPEDYRRSAPAPSSTLPGPALNSTEAIRDSIAGIRNFHQGAVVNPYQLGKEQLFGAGLNHHQYERYYEHPKFNTLGFTPFRDNETFYNQNSSGWDDFQRSWGEWATLTGLGLKDAFGFGDLTDPENAKTYERAMAIGSSTRGGMTGFANNLFLNSGYTIGILGELALEELGLAILTAGTLGAASPATVPLMAARGIGAVNKVKNAWKASTAIIKSLDNLKDINKAREYMRSARNNFGRVLNPLEQTTDFINNYGKLNNLDKLAKVSLGVGSLYRDVRNLRLVWGESSLEGGMVQNRMEEELLAEHYAKYDRPPTNEEASRIQQTALEAGASTAIWNMPTIFMSNKIVFDNMFKTFSPIRRLTTDVITQGTAGKIIKTAAKESPFVVMENNFKGFIKGLKDPRSYARTGLNYFKANFAEGLQESAQEVISGSVMDYYKSNFNSPVRGGAWSSIGDNISKQFTAEGAEIFFSGFLMGGMVQPITKIPGYVKTGFSRIKDPEGYQKMKVARAEHLNKTVSTLNDMYNDPAKYLAPDLENLVAQQQYQKGMNEAADNGDPKSYHDLKDASVFQHVITALQLGKMDGFVERLESLKDLNENEIKEAFPNIEDTKGFSQAINSSVERARQIEKRYNAMQTKHPNPFNPSQHKYGSPEYIGEYLNHAAYEKAVQNVVFMQHSFDRTIKRMADLQREIKDDSELQKVSASDFNALMTIEDTQSEISQLRQELKALEGDQMTTESRKLKAQKTRKLELLKEFSDNMDAYLSLGKNVSEKTKEISNEIADEFTDRPVEIENKSERKAMNKLYRSYEKYLKHLAGVNKEHAFDANLANSFQKLLDFYNLQDDTVKLTEAVNTLTNPGGFSRHAQRIAEVMQHEHANRKAKIAQVLEEYLKMKDSNELLIALYKEGMFFDPEQLDALLKQGTLPDKFYYAVGKGQGSKLDEVLQTSPDYNKALDIVSKFVEHVLNKPISEKAACKGYCSFVRNPINGDNRTYRDYAEQFGFDPTAAETKLPLKDVLQVIINSPYASYREKALATRLLSMARDTETVSFRKNMSVPGTYDAISQTVVDARYASSDFETGGTPLESIILHQEIHRHTQDSLLKDNKFKGDIQALFDHVSAYLEQPAVKEKMNRPAQGMVSLQDFVAEAMTNDSFQRFLAEIPYEKTEGATSWTGFIDSVVRMLKRFFGKNSSNTALNGAINIITTQIESDFGTKSSQQKAHAGDPKVTPATVMDYITGEGLDTDALMLQKDLLKAYRDFNAARVLRDEPIADVNYADKSDSQLLADARFIAYATSSIFSSVNKAIKKYNDATGRTETVERKAGTTEAPKTAARIVSREMKATLLERGYSEADIRVMNATQAQQVIDSGVTMADIEAAQERDALTVQEELIAQRQEIRSNIDSILNSVDTLQDLERAEEEILAIVSDPEKFDIAGYKTTDEITAMIELKKRDLAFTVTFDDIREGEVVIMNDNFQTKMVVQKKTLTTLHLHKIDDVTFTRKVNSKKVSEAIKFRYSPAMEKMGIPMEEMTPTEQTLLNDDLNSAQELNNHQTIQEDLDIAKNKSEQELDDEFLNDITKCER